MHKIANSNELQIALRRIMAKAQEPNPSRVTLSYELAKLAKALGPTKVASGWPNMPQGANEYDDIPSSQFGKWTPAVKKELTEMLQHVLKNMKRKDPKTVDRIVDRQSATQLRDEFLNIPYNFAHPSAKDMAKYKRPPSNTTKSMLFGVSATADVTRLVAEVVKILWPEAYKKITQFTVFP